MDREPRGADRRASLRAGDADRERTVAELRQHHADGRLTLDEFDERMNQAYAAKTLGELDRLLADLPPLAARPPVPAGPAHPAVPEHARRDFYRHLSSYVTTNAFLVLIWAVTGAHAFWPIWVIAFWGIGLASHAARVFVFHEEFGQRQRRRDRRSW